MYKIIIFFKKCVTRCARNDIGIPTATRKTKYLTFFGYAIPLLCTICSNDSYNNSAFLLHLFFNETKQICYFVKTQICNSLDKVNLTALPLCLVRS